VQFAQIDLGLETEIAVPPSIQQDWHGRLLLDWGVMPGSYAWVFPKGDRLTIGVIAARGLGAQTKVYLSQFLRRLGLSEFEHIHDSGHLTRCRTDYSPLRNGKVLVAGDAAGLLEPWTREGISFALRSGAIAGSIAAQASIKTDEHELDSILDQYIESINEVLIPEMKAGWLLLRAFAKHPSPFHAGLATPKGWQTFVKICQSKKSFSSVTARPVIRLALSAMSRA
jgi:flavin-dependent dehydrogenase